MNTTSTSLQPQRSPLVGLPPELRNKIYSDALVETSSVYIFCKKDYRNWFALGRSEKHLYWHSPPLLQSCRQIRSEASSIYYSGNYFTIVDEGLWPTPLGMWLSALDTKDIRNLSEVRVHSYQFELTFCLVKDLMCFWKSLQNTERSLGKEVLRMKVVVEKRAPSVTDPRDCGVVESEFLSVARLEKASIEGDTVVEDGSEELKRLLD